MGSKVSSRKIMTTEPGLLLGPNHLLLHSDRYRPASQEQDWQEVCFPKVFVKWTLHYLTGDIVQLFVFEDPSKLMPKKVSPCSFLTWQTLQHSRLASKRLLEMSSSRYSLHSFYHNRGLSECQSHRSKISSPEELLHLHQPSGRPQNQNRPLIFHLRKPLSRHDLLLTQGHTTNEGSCWEMK